MEKATEVLENRNVILSYPIKLEEEGEFGLKFFLFQLFINVYGAECRTKGADAQKLAVFWSFLCANSVWPSVRKRSCWREHRLQTLPSALLCEDIVYVFVHYNDGLSFHVDSEQFLTPWMDGFQVKVYFNVTFIKSSLNLLLY